MLLHTDTDTDTKKEMDTQHTIYIKNRDFTKYLKIRDLEKSDKKVKKIVQNIW